MKAAWDWHHPRATPDERRRLIDLISDIGFDTIVVGNPHIDLIERAHTRDIRVIGVVSPSAGDEFAANHPEAIQRMLPYETRMLEALAGENAESLQRMAHRWFPLVQGGSLVCYEHEASRNLLVARIEELLTTADGVALDGFGFRNHYACFCDLCVSRHKNDPEAIADISEQSLVSISEVIYDAAHRIRPDAIVMNHVWPPFNPNPYYGCNLRLDYCTQTISWFYRPVWEIRRVRLEAELHKSLERRDRNRFVPFIGLYADGYQTRSLDRLEAEFSIAHEYGEGSFVVCTLQGPMQDSGIRRIVQKACNR